MPSGRIVLVFVGAALAVAAVGGIYYAKKKASSSGQSVRSSIKGNSGGAANPQTSEQDNQSRDIALTTTSFIGSLTPGGTTESAGKERNYVVTYQVAFLRKSPAEKLPEESMSYQQLMQQDLSKLPPYVYYGEVVRGTFDPSHPDSIAVVAKIDKKDVRGYVDSQKLWLEPEIVGVETPRYTALRDGTAIHVVPDASSPTVLTILQGEVAETVGKLNFRGNQWMKARYNANEQPRYGFIQAADLLPLTLATVNQSAVALEEVPPRIRQSDISLADADRQKLSQTGFYIEAIPPKKDVYVDDITEIRDTDDSFSLLRICSSMFTT